MTPPVESEFDDLFQQWRNGDRRAGSELIELVYGDLRRMARSVLRPGVPDNTLQPTAIANEACLKLLKCDPTRLNDRRHFYATAAVQMRNILVDYLRTRPVEKRVGQRIPIEEIDLPLRTSSVDLLELARAMKILRQISPRAHQVVELRYIAGLSEKESAEILEISVTTLKREWSFAKGVLANELGGARGRIEILPPRRQRRVA